ncbi:DUF2572 family protein [Rodentibacter heidelbergensis]|uniref:DUF2572 family protein n=1 Tax=Rodentibacter heidelbergensis TaxID=1908258 RepID=UPI001FCA0892|nr:DUF2572 family protein [Rodentibacter heidelbergensis]
MESIRLPSGRKGIVTLSILIFLSGVFAVMLFFDESTLSFFRAQQMQRQYYVEQTLTLQKQTLQAKQKVCSSLPLAGSERVRQVFINRVGAEEAIRYSLWCQRIALFKKLPKKGENQGLLKALIDLENLDEFRPHFATPPYPLVNAMPQLYWFYGKQNQWEVRGTAQGIFIAEGDLVLRGKGRVSGAVITGGKLSLDGVIVAYGKKQVELLAQQYSKWQLAEKSWSDFNASSQ